MRVNVLECTALFVNSICVTGVQTSFVLLCLSDVGQLADLRPQPVPEKL